MQAERCGGLWHVLESVESGCTCEFMGCGMPDKVGPDYTTLRSWDWILLGRESPRGRETVVVICVLLFLC